MEELPTLNRRSVLLIVVGGLIVAGVAAYLGVAFSGTKTESPAAVQCAELGEQLKTAVTRVADDDRKTLAEFGQYIAWTKDGCPNRLSARDARALIQRVGGETMTPAAGENGSGDGEATRTPAASTTVGR